MVSVYRVWRHLFLIRASLGRFLFVPMFDMSVHMIPVLYLINISRVQSVEPILIERSTLLVNRKSLSE